jgi:hypothetical protein
MIELELLAIAWAAKKCSNFIEGLPKNRFMIITNHKPLLPILNSYSLVDVPSKRLQRLRSKIDHLQFIADWVPTKQNIADALSRYPVERAGPGDEIDEVEGSEAALQVANVFIDGTTDEEGIPLSKIVDLRLVELKLHCDADPHYSDLKAFIEQGFPDCMDRNEEWIQPFRRFVDQLHIDDDGFVCCSGRLYIPQSLRSVIVKRLIGLHQGLEKTKQRARSSVWWPGLNNELKVAAQGCKNCTERTPSQRAEELRPHPPATFPFEFVHADLCSLFGRQFLVMADQYSGWPEVFELGKEATTETVWRNMASVFHRFGYPVTIFTDGGPQFRDSFVQICHQHGINHVSSSPHYPQSNGLAETNVKSAKKLIEANFDPVHKCLKPSFQESLLLFRNTERKPTGLSPSKILFARQLRDSLPVSRDSMKPLARAEVDRRVTELRNKQQREGKIFRKLSLLTPGTRCFLQHPTTRRWNTVVTVQRFAANDREYEVTTHDGRVFRRNRRFLKPIIDSSGAPLREPAHSKSGGSGDTASGSGDKASGSGDKASGSGDKASGLGDKASGLGDKASGSGNARSRFDNTASRSGAKPAEPHEMAQPEGRPRREMRRPVRFSE